ncbi:MAG TPA: hybrid sensor histidine kinase/response regulator [Myxococcaceae bacterium]|nr:hybrid sensor histidine kinase/response regulator [Myxococcaceae bacterium]
MVSLRVLILEDSDIDRQLLLKELRDAGFLIASKCVDTAKEMQQALSFSEWDVVLSDYNMPGFNALEALRILQESKQKNLPFIIVSGSIGEASAVAALKAGASNYVMKTNLPELVPVLERELKDAQMRRERGEAVEALRQVIKARDEFLSISSHELKTPLTALQLQIHSLLRAAKAEHQPLSSAQVVSKLETVAHASTRLIELIDGLLDITRVRTGRLELCLRRFDITEAARNVIERLRDLFRDAGSQVSLESPGALVGDWDFERIETVISNLLTNAAKYGAGKPVKVGIEDIDDRARLKVSDQGIGISPADQQRVFERFERAAPDRHYGGFGVGLWLSKRIIDAHGGTIDISSQAGKGATFTVTLPKAPPQ